MLIRHRLLIAALINLFIVVVVAYAALFSTLQIQTSQKQVSEEILPIIRSLEQIKFGALRIVSSTSEAGLLKNLEAEEISKEQELNLTEYGYSIVTEATEQYQHMTLLHNRDDLEIYPTMQQDVEFLIATSRQFYKTLEIENSSETLLELKGQLEVIEQKILRGLEVVLSHESEDVAKLNLQSTQSVNQLLFILIAGIFVIIGFSSLLVWYNSKHISTPLRRLQHSVDQVAAGNLDDQSFTQEGKDEISQLSLAFQNMTAALKKHQKMILDSHQYTENILQVMEDILIVTDASGIIQKINRAACDQMGFTKKDLIGTQIDKILIQLGKHRSLSRFYTIMHGGNVESTLVNKQGHQVPVLVSLSRINKELEDDSDYLLVATNISERKVAEEKIHKLAFYDALTGLPNRTLFADRLKQALKVSDRQQTMLAVLFLDIDNFKQVNDTLGHAVGDGMLREISDVLTLAVRNSDVISHGSGTSAVPNIPTISRHGGDEFLILLPDISDHDDIYQVADRILQQVGINIVVEDHELFTTMSIGIAIYPQHGENERLLIQNADTALYNAKAAGKNQYSVFETHMNHSVLRHVDIENNLRNALKNDEFRLYYQPQLDVSSNRVIGMEALIRWHHPEWSIVSPLEFIPIAESNGLILPIGEWVIREACNQWVHWKTAGYDPGKISINLSAGQFKNNELRGLLLNVIEETGIDTDAMVLEITESILMQDAELTHTQLEFIKDQGIHLSVDDFGTGYSSLSYLKNFSLDFLKIDRSFIRDLESSENDQEIVRTIINMAMNMNLKLVAEGVETQGQAQILKIAGCHYMQGSLLSSPVIASEYEEMFLKTPLPHDTIKIPEYKSS